MRFIPALIFACLAPCLNGIAAASPNGNPTVDVMRTGTLYGYAQTYSSFGFQVGPVATSYLLSDGTSWPMGAGSFSTLYSTVASVASNGGVFDYTFQQPADGILFRNTDFSFGDHSASGVLGTPPQLVLEATSGATTGVIRGYTQILANDPTFYSSFNYYSAAVGQSVYFETVVSLLGGATFSRDLFDHAFAYSESGFVDFTQVQAVPEPGTAALLVAGFAALAAGLKRSKRAVAT